MVGRDHQVHKGLLVRVNHVVTVNALVVVLVRIQLQDMHEAVVFVGVRKEVQEVDPVVGIDRVARCRRGIGLAPKCRVVQDMDVVVTRTPG